MPYKQLPPFVPAQMTTAQRDAVYPDSPTGLTILNSDVGTYQCYIGERWVSLAHYVTVASAAAPTVDDDESPGKNHSIGDRWLNTTAGEEYVCLDASAGAAVWKRTTRDDAGDFTYAPAVLTDWDGDADPGDLDDALDQLAERVDDIEGGSVIYDADEIEYIPVEEDDWEGEPEALGEAADELAERLTDHEGHGNWNEAGIGFWLDGGGSEIADGIVEWLPAPFACTIKAVRLFADQDGAIKLDFWKAPYLNYPPTDTDSITGGNEPEIVASGDKYEDTTLSGWTVTVAKGEIIYCNVDSCTTIEKCLVALEVDKT